MHTQIQLNWFAALAEKRNEYRFYQSESIQEKWCPTGAVRTYFKVISRYEKGEEITACLHYLFVSL